MPLRIIRLCSVLKSKIQDSVVPEGATCGVEFVINGFDESLVKKSMREGILELTSKPGIIKITAGNYGGKLGKLFYHLKEIVS
jgi:formylmethanofuran--tetrahydromethanopterin N-formyltransferase